MENKEFVIVVDFGGHCNGYFINHKNNSDRGPPDHIPEAKHEKRKEGI